MCCIWASLLVNCKYTGCLRRFPWAGERAPLVMEILDTFPLITFLEKDGSTYVCKYWCHTELGHREVRLESYAEPHYHMDS